MKPSSDAAIEHNVDPALIRSIIAAESSFEPDAESTAGAVGYMQIHAGDSRGTWVRCE